MGRSEILGAAEILGLDDYNDDFGAEVILGDDDDLLGAISDILGAAPKNRGATPQRGGQRGGGSSQMQALNKMIAQRNAKKSQQLEQVASRIQAARSGVAVVEEKEATRSRSWIVGFDSVANVGAGLQFVAITNPQCVFRAERLVIGAAIAPSFIVNDIRVGKDSQVLNATPVPGDCFSPGAVNANLRLDTCQVSQQLVLVVTNVSLAPLRFIAAMFGTALS